MSTPTGNRSGANSYTMPTGTWLSVGVFRWLRTVLLTTTVVPVGRR
jgi:hypothetical protein